MGPSNWPARQYSRMPASARTFGTCCTSSSACTSRTRPAKIPSCFLRSGRSSPNTNTTRWVKSSRGRRTNYSTVMVLRRTSTRWRSWRRNRYLRLGPIYANSLVTNNGEGADMKILMVLTSHSELGNTGKKTGLWLEEFAAPYFVFRDEGADIALASPRGGQPPIDPKSEEPGSQTDTTERFKRDAGAQTALATTVKLSTVVAEDFDAVFYPGGHGPLWDLAEDKHSIALIESMYAAGNPVALVCHAPGALRNAKAQDGSLLVKGKRVTGFTNTEEQAVQLTKVVPFLVEDELKRLGGLYAKGPDWASFVQVDGNLITGQNPASSSAVAQEQLKMLATLHGGAATRSS